MDSDYLDNIFEKAVFGINLIKNRKTLTIDYVPEKLPFRDEESKTIAQVLSVVLKKGRPSNLLVFGKPGTGKTAVVKNVINRLKKKSIEHGIEITVTIVNAKTANTSYKVLYDIAEDLWGQIKLIKSSKFILQDCRWEKQRIEFLNILKKIIFM